jgi:hypothetical protein
VVTLALGLGTVVPATFVKLHHICKRILKYFSTPFATRQVLVFFTSLLLAVVFECLITVVLATLLYGRFRVVFRSSQHCFTKTFSSISEVFLFATLVVVGCKPFDVLKVD